MQWWGRRFRLPSCHHNRLPSRQPGHNPAQGRVRRRPLDDHPALRIDMGQWRLMKTTLEIPDDLFRRAKSAAAEQGIPLRELVSEALAEELRARGLPGQAVAEGVRQATWPARGDRAHQPDYRGRIWPD